MEQINLDLIPGRIPPVCHASQYDVGRVIRINLTEGYSQPYTIDGTETITLNVRKTDGNMVTSLVTIVANRTYVDIVTTQQMTACYGSNICDLTIEKNNAVIGTLNFILEVEKDPLDGSSSSASEIYNLTAQVASIVSVQYDSENVIFDTAPTAQHGVPYTVTSEGVKNAIAAVNVDDLHDVDITSPSNNQVLKYDASSQKWVNGPDVGAIDLNDIRDVDIDDTTLTDNDSLIYDATAEKWVNGEGGKKTLEELNDVDIDDTSLADGDALVYNATTNKWINAEAGKKTLAELNDVDLTTTPTDKQVLIYDDTTDMWIAGDGSRVWQGTQAQYDALTEIDPDVTYFITDGQQVTASMWEGTAAEYAQITDPDPGTFYFITDSDAIACNLNQLNDVNINTPASGQSLVYNGSKWVNGEPANTMRCAYTSQNNLTTYDVNYDTLAAVSGRQFGMALVFAWKDIFALFYNSDNTIFISPLTPNPSRTASVSWISSTRDIRITFDQQVWLGISVYPV